MKVLLIYPDNQRYNFIVPLGLAYIGAVLKRAGHIVTALDIDAYKYTPKEVIHMIKRFDYDVVCTGGLITTYNYERWLISEIKKYHPHIKVIVGGNLITSAPMIFMENSLADVGVIGEGEYLVLDIIKRYGNSGQLDDVSGIIFRKNGRLIKTPVREEIEDLDNLPFPLRELFPVEHYTKLDNVVIKGRRLRSQGIIGSRGCPYRCTYCCRAFGNKLRYRSPQNIVEELKFLKKVYSIQAFMFNDEIFNTSKERVISICEEIIRNNLSLKWNACCRVNGIDMEMLRIMKRAGCFRIGYGIESGSEKILKEMKKAFTLNMARDAIEMTYNAGIDVVFTFMVGMPGETKETINETLKFRKELNRFRSNAAQNIFYTTPYPGTELYDMLIRSGKIKDEVRYIESLSAQGKAWDFLINLTSLSDEELIRLKERHQRKVFRDYYLKNKFKIIDGLIIPFIKKLIGIEFLYRVYRKLNRLYLKKKFLKKHPFIYRGVGLNQILL